MTNLINEIMKFNASNRDDLNTVSFSNYIQFVESKTKSTLIHSGTAYKIIKLLARCQKLYIKWCCFAIYISQILSSLFRLSQWVAVHDDDDQIMTTTTTITICVNIQIICEILQLALSTLFEWQKLSCFRLAPKMREKYTTH